MILKFNVFLEFNFFIIKNYKNSTKRKLHNNNNNGFNK